MGALPRHIIRRSGKRLCIERAPRKWKHRHRLTHPYTFLLQLFLPAMNLRAIVALRENQIRLHPRDAATSIDQQLRDSVCAYATIFIQVFTAFMRDGFHTAFHGDAVGAAKKIQSFFIPEINARLKADLYRTLSNALQQTTNIFTDPKDFIDEINVLDAARDQRIHFLENGMHAALAEFIAKESLVAEGACPRASTSKLQFSAKTMVIGEYVMAMPVRFNVVILEIKRSQGGHIRNSRTGADVQLPIFFTEAAADNLMPRLAGEFRQNLVGFST